LRRGLEPFQDQLILPEATENSDPSWFGFLITLRPESGLSRPRLMRFLDARKIGTRQLFGGNLTMQPAYKGLPFRVAAELTNTDIVMRNSFWVGVYPGLTEPMLQYVIDSMGEFLQKKV
jgi:CDP-6-deoxy-D-xylo-4-hexulose-3-dehydrase